MPVPNDIDPKSSSKPIGYRILSGITVGGALLFFALIVGMALSQEFRLVWEFLVDRFPDVTTALVANGVDEKRFRLILTVAMPVSLVLAIASAFLNAKLYGEHVAQQQIDSNVNLAKKMSTLDQNVILRVVISLVLAWFGAGFVPRFVYAYVPLTAVMLAIAVVAYLWVVPWGLRRVVDQGRIASETYEDLEEDGFELLHFDANEDIAAEANYRGYKARVELDRPNRNTRENHPSRMFVSVGVSRALPLSRVCVEDAKGTLIDGDTSEIAMEEFNSRGFAVGAADEAATLELLRANREIVLRVMGNSYSLLIEGPDAEDSEGLSWITVAAFLYGKDGSRISYKVILDPLIELAAAIEGRPVPA